ncbi:kelch repeat and BTB domain-containing protein 8-like [Physella acuta]|uniref:kelch repeat and BTB domain-containing protein 8-like n=1 Tax=Physella acuta TaxID=109671 RepID=UPI0027DBF271|nr:kelch repeat and BTB domain-containing protein 8-like [Physella acuta]
MSSSDLCTKIVHCLQNLWKEKMLFDFLVKINDETIQCHRVILAACSDFFLAMFRSGMKEATENCVVLKEISSEVFQLILKSIYTGANLLTLENFIEVWRAVQMLQIKVMIDLSENFAIEAITMDTWENIYTNANFLCSERVLNELHSFMLKNFEKISLSQTFLQLPCKKLQDLIKSQDLVVSSEDLVMESVIKWVTYDNSMTGIINERNVSVDDPIEDDLNKNKKMILDADSHLTSETSARKDCLTQLLGTVRTCLVRPTVLSRVLKINFVSENKDSRDIIVDALKYHVQDFRHGQWPSAAVRRSCSGYKHVGVSAKSDGKFEVLDASNGKWCAIKRCQYLQENIQLLNFDGELYATGKQYNDPDEPCRMFAFCDNSWKEVLEMPSDNLLLASHGESIFVLNKDDKFIFYFNPKKKFKKKLEKLTPFPDNVVVQHAMVFEDVLLLFSSGSQNGIHLTIVHQLDIVSKVWTRLDNLEGPAKNLISFRNDNHNYILQKNGTMSLVSNSSYNMKTEIQFLVKIWQNERKLFGGFTHEGELILFGKVSKDGTLENDLVRDVFRHFKSMCIWGPKDNCSNCVPVILPSKCFS